MRYGSCQAALTLCQKLWPWTAYWSYRLAEAWIVMSLGCCTGFAEVQDRTPSFLLPGTPSILIFNLCTPSVYNSVWRIIMGQRVLSFSGRVVLADLGPSMGKHAGNVCLAAEALVHCLQFLGLIAVMSHTVTIRIPGLCLRLYGTFTMSYYYRTNSSLTEENFMGHLHSQGINMFLWHFIRVTGRHSSRMMK